MTADERARLESLDAVVRSNELRAKIKAVVDRVCAVLAQKPEAMMTWEPMPLETFRQKLPPEIRSGWVFVCAPALIPERNGIQIVINA